MLIQITNRCHMGCKHCLQDASPNGKHMTDETFDRVMDFCMEARPMVVNVTGGEPTEHPNWVGYVKTLFTLPSCINSHLAAATSSTRTSSAASPRKWKC